MCFCLKEARVASFGYFDNNFISDQADQFPESFDVIPLLDL